MATGTEIAALPVVISMSMLALLVLSNPVTAQSLDQQMTNAFQALCGTTSGYQDTVARARDLGWSDAPARFDDVYEVSLGDNPILEETKFASGSDAEGRIFANVASQKGTGLRPNKRNTICFLRFAYPEDVDAFGTYVSRTGGDPKIGVSPSGRRTAKWSQLLQGNLTIAMEDPATEGINMSTLLQVWGDTGR